MKLKALIASLLAVAMITGCTETMPKKAAVNAETARSQAQDLTQARFKQTEPMGIPIELEKTSIRPFIALLGNPDKQSQLAEDHVVVMYVSNRLGSASQNETPIVVVLPENDPRLEKLSSKVLLLDLKKTKNDWVIAGIRMNEVKTPELKLDAKEAKQQANTK